jgi:hypothetical protein
MIEVFVPEPRRDADAALPDSLIRMREVGAPVRVELIPKARAIMGFGLFVVRGTRPDGLFAGVSVSQHTVVSLTDYVWECVLRWDYYLSTLFARFVTA